MTRLLDVKREEKQALRDQQLIRAIEFELVGSVGHSGGILEGFSASLEEEDVMVVLRAEVAGRRQVAFVFSDSLAACLRKCVRLALRDKLVWRVDKYAEDDVCSLES